MKSFLNLGLRHRALHTALVSGLAAAALMTSPGAAAESRVTYKSAKAGTSYYQMGVEIAQAMKEGSKGDIIVTLEESQGSVQNVMEAANRKGNYVFTSPPSLVAQAGKGEGAFAKNPNPKFQDIRALFPIPALTMHFVVRDDAGIKRFEDMAGKNVLIGRGTFSANEAEKYLKLFGLDGKVNLSNVELNNAVAALKNKQIDAFVTAGSFPSPNVIEAAASIPISILSMSDAQVAQTGATRAVIPANTYNGQTKEIITTSLPVIAYTTTEMGNDVAYKLTETFWEQRNKMANTAPWWNSVTPDLVMNITGKIHPGALKYYTEKGIAVPATAK